MKRLTHAEKKRLARTMREGATHAIRSRAARLLLSSRRRGHKTKHRKTR